MNKIIDYKNKIICVDCIKLMKEMPENSVEIGQIKDYLEGFLLNENSSKTKVDSITIGNRLINRYTNEFWTSKQRQASSIHEVSYRACFKPQLPRFFIELLTRGTDVVYDPFSGRGTTVIEAALLGRKIISNDINPLSEIFAKSRLYTPDLNDVNNRLSEIILDKNIKANIDLSMFYHKDTESEIVSLKNYLDKRQIENKEDYLDQWIRMVATNRLTGHSSGFFSVYTLPPNQAVTQESQLKINAKRKQIPQYRDTKKIILRKTKNLIKDLTCKEKDNLQLIKNAAIFLRNDARNIPEIKNDTVQLTVTSPPFLDIVQYSKDNWLRCWFNSIDTQKTEKGITMAKKVEEWTKVMSDVFKELYRITKHGGWVAFEVGEVKQGKIRLDELVVPLGINVGFNCFGIVINQQEFTKTANIWGVKNNAAGTNTNRIVLFFKG